jgi:hypothetical protein
MCVPPHLIASRWNAPVVNHTKYCAPTIEERRYRLKFASSLVHCRCKSALFVKHKYDQILIAKLWALNSQNLQLGRPWEEKYCHRSLILANVPPHAWRIDSMSEFQQFNVLLPENLAGFLKTEAARRDFTISGLLRHYVSEAHRAAPREGAPTFPDAIAPVVPAFPATPKGIAAAKERLAAMNKEREQILKRKARWQTTVDEDTKVDRLVAEIEVTSKRIEMAEKMLPRNGG